MKKREIFQIIIFCIGFIIISFIVLYSLLIFLDTLLKSLSDNIEKNIIESNIEYIRDYDFISIDVNNQIINIDTKDIVYYLSINRNQIEIRTNYNSYVVDTNNLVMIK